MLRAAVSILAVAIFLQYYGFITIIKYSSPVVSTKNGKVEGKIAYSREGHRYFQYLGLPFAEPPVNELRYEPPIPLRNNWSGTKQATSYPPFCLQFDAALRGKILGEEDCLYLNVFTRSVEQKRPVIVWLHGGGFFSGGSSLYYPEFYMDHDIVLVTLNYRLGPLGFMNLNDGHISGNMGLKDQNLALQWVRQNIANFGGDPNQVTLAGENAGAVSVQYHMLSPASKGLFHRAILQSGAVTMPTAFSPKPKDTAMEFIKNTNCFQKIEWDLIKCIKNLDPVELIQQQIGFMNPVAPPLAFLPSVEISRAKDAFLTENPRKLLKSGNVANSVPLMIGVTSGEGALRTASLEKYPELVATLDNNWDQVAAHLLFYDQAREISPEKAKLIKTHYFAEITRFTEDFHAFKRNFSVLASDAIFMEPIYRAALLHAQIKESPVYLYYYDYEATLLPSVYSLLRAVRHDDWILADAKIGWASVVDLAKKWLGLKGPHEFGVPHSGGLLMQWNMEGWTSLLSGPDVHFSKAYVQSIVDFAKNEKNLAFDGISWPAVRKTKYQDDTPFMLMSSYARVINDPIRERIRFWSTLKIGD